jgi:hypothetical protein
MIKRADPLHCAAQPHVEPARGHLAQGPPGKIPNAHMAMFDGAVVPTGPLLPPVSTTPPPVLTTPWYPRCLMCADSHRPYPLGVECKVAPAFLLLMRFSATPLHFPSSPSRPSPINPFVAAAALLRCAPAADEPPQALLHHRPSVPRVIIDQSFTASQAIPQEVAKVELTPSTRP